MTPGKKYILPAVLCSLLIAACVKDKGKPVPDSLPGPVAAHTPPAAPLNPVDSCKTGVKYSAQVSKIVSRSCALEGCHVASGYRDFSTYDLLRSEIERMGKEYFLLRLGPEGGMPPSYSETPGITACEIEKLEAWVNEGYKNN